MIKKTSLILIFLMMFIYLTPVKADNNYPYFEGADAYLLMDLNSGEVLVEYNTEETLYPASITKIMTGIIAIEMGESNQKMTASAQAVYDIGKDGMNIGIQAGEVLEMDDLLGALLIASANETANIIAENICETRDEFIVLMNQKAKEIGATNTIYTNPCGMHDSAHYTTAMDVALIARYAMQNDKFRDFVKRDFYKMSPTNKHSSWNTLYSSNTLMKSEPDVPYDIIGVKTGYTDPAGKCLVSAAKDDNGNEYITVVMGVTQYDAQSKIEEITLGLFNYAFSNFNYTKLLNKDSYIDMFEMPKAKDNMPVVLISSDDVWSLLDKDIDVDNISMDFSILDDVKLPILKGDIVAEGKFINNEETITTFNIEAANEVEEMIIIEVVEEAEPEEESGGFMVVFNIIIYVILSLIVILEILKIVGRVRRKKRKAKKERIGKIK